MWTDRQTDVGHINLIGRMVTHNPPKNSQLRQARIPRQDGASKQATKRCAKRRVAQAAIRLATGQSVFKLESGHRNLDGQTNGQNNSNFKRNLAMTIYLPVKLEPFSSWHPEIEILMDRQTNKKRTNQQTQLHQF